VPERARAQTAHTGLAGCGARLIVVAPG
jgi:hypothetical protein